jgi:beta-lactam-binding protein with PASTA domain
MSSNFKTIVTSKPFVKNLIFAVISVIVALFILGKFLGVYTHHGEAFSVPDFTGMTYEQALKLADNKDLKIKIIDSVYAAPGRRGTIIDQNPPRDFKVKENRTIFVTIKSFNAEIIKMPDFINTTLVQAKADIETYGLKIEKLIYVPSIYDNLVLKQQFNGEDIKAGEKIEKGSKITLVLGRSSEMDNTIAPNLIGLFKEQAEFKAAEYMLNIGTVLFDNSVISYSDSVNCKVIKQRPTPGTPFNPGQEIDIWLSMKSDTLNTDYDVNE